MRIVESQIHIRENETVSLFPRAAKCANLAY